MKLSKADAISVNVGERHHDQRPLRREPDVDRRRRRRTRASPSRARSARSTRPSSRTTCRDEALARAVEQSERLAKLAPDDPEAMPGARPADVSSPSMRTSTSTANARRRRARARGAHRARAGAQGGRPQAAGYLVVEHRHQRARQQARGCSRTTAARTRTTRSPCAPTDGTGSGWAGAEHPRLDEARLRER